ncbi:MAG: hypothetical protein ACPGYY_02905 [Bacteroidia bacterium]
MKKSVLILGMTLVLSSCISDLRETVDKAQNVKGIEWNPTIAAPLIHSRLSLRDLLDEVGEVEFLKVDDEGGMTLVYSDGYKSKTAEEVLVLQDQQYSETFTLTPTQLSELNTNGTLVVTFDRSLDYILGPNETDRIVFKGGDFNLSLSSSLQHDVKMKVTVMEGKKNGSLFTEVLNSTFTGAPNEANSSTSLDGVDIDLTKTAKGHSQMDVQFELTVTKNAINPILISETISYEMGLVDQKFKEMHGYYDPQNFSSASDIFKLGFFENNTGGTFTLKDPRIKFILTNSLGFPLEARVLRFEGTNSSNNKIDLTGYPDPFPVPNLGLADVGLKKVDSFSMDASNSNLAAFINNRPSEVLYEFAVNSIASGVDRQWVLDTSLLEVQVDIEVPMEGTARDFSMENSQEFSLDLESTEEIKEVLVRLYTENGFPVDISTQLYFEDSASNTVLDSLLTSDILILPAGEVDGAGRVVAPNPKTTDIVLDASTIDRIKNADRLRIKAYFNTPFDSGGTTQPDVKFYDNYDVFIQLGVQAEVLINQDL